MMLTITSATKTIFGLWEINVKINNKPYRYELSSDYSYGLMMSHYRAGRHGNCLAVLNKYREDEG